MLDAQFFYYFALLVMLGSFVHGFTGLGFGIIVIAGLSFTTLNLERAAAVLNILLPVLFFAVIFFNKGSFRLGIQWRLAILLMLCSFVGVPLGYLFLYAYGNMPVFHIALGFVLVVFSLDYLLRPRFRSRLPLPVGMAAGFSGGFLAGAFTAGGPPVALFLYTHFENPHEAKGTLQLIFLGTTWWRLMNIHFLGHGFNRQVILWAAVFVPLVLGLAFVGNLAARRLSPKAFTRVVYGFIGTAGLVNILRYLPY